MTTAAEGSAGDPLGATYTSATGFTTAPPAPAQCLAGSIIISQVYGGGGNAGAPYANDFIEPLPGCGDLDENGGRDVVCAPCRRQRTQDGFD